MESSTGNEMNDYPNNLILIDEHNDQSLFECISGRLQKGELYTMAGSILISTSSDSSPALFSEKQKENYLRPSCEEPHLYAVSSKVYKHLQSSYQNQVITLLGYSGSGKTFAAIHLIDHLCYLAGNSEGFTYFHAALQVLHVMGSSFARDNGESSNCGIVCNLIYDSDFSLIGGQFKAKLLDYSLPYSATGNTYHILHALVTASKTQLQSLGLSSMPSFRIFNNHQFSTKEIIHHGQNFDRFFRNLQTLKFSRSEIQEVLEMFSVVILLFEISFVGSQFVVANDKEHVEWAPRHRTAVKKVCKILLISEEKFLEVFQGVQHKSLVDARLRELARSIYYLTFEWVLFKINERIKRIKGDSPLKGKKEERFSPVYQIAVVDFPGFHHSNSLSGFCSNLSLECLNLFASERLLSLIHSFENEKISIKILQDPISRDLVSLLLSKEVGLLANLEQDNFEKYWKEFRQVTKDHPYIKTSNLSLSIKYTWGEVDYDLASLRLEIKKIFHCSEFSLFFSKCSNNIVRKIVTPGYLSLAESLRKDLSVLIEPLVGYDNSLVYFLKGFNGKLDYSDTIRLFRNTLILPALYWEWYGYGHWVSNAKLLNDLGVNQDSAGKTHIFLNSLLKEVLNEDEFVVGLHYTLMKDQAFAVLNEKCLGQDLKFDQEIRNDATFKAFSPKNEKKIIKARSSKFLNDYGSAFYYNCYGEQPLVQSEIYEYLDSVADINDVSFKKDTFSRKSSKLTSLNSASSLKDTLQTVQSQKHFKRLQNSLSNFRLLNYSDQLASIIKIQSTWKSYQAKKYFKAYLLLKSKASKIQATWKAYKQSSNFRLIKTKVQVLQKFFKKRFNIKVAAAKKIQSWFRNFLQSQTHIDDISSQVSSIENASLCIHPSNPSNASNFLKRSILKPTQSKHPEETFKPVLCKNSRTLAKIRENKLGNGNLPVEKRLEVMNLLKNNKIEDLRKSKIDEERLHIKSTPTINNSKFQDLASSFLQRQERKTLQIRMKREKEVVKKQSEELANATFKPTLVSKNCKSMERSVKDLQVWAEVKKFQITRAQKQKADDETRSVSPYQMSSNSKRILQERQSRLAEQIKLASEVKESLLPYWPNKANINKD